MKTSTTMAGVLSMVERQPIAGEIRVASLMLCGTPDVYAEGHSQQVYDDVPESTPKMLLEIAEAYPMNWIDPKLQGSGVAGGYALAFHKVFLEGDQRWKPLLLVS